MAPTWRAIVPVKGWGQAKTRLALPSRVRRQLAAAMTYDTLNAVASSDAVLDVTVVTADPSLTNSSKLAAADLVLVQPPEVALAEALAWAMQQLTIGPSESILLVVADLPALTTDALGAAISAAPRHADGMVADRHGIGTTLLTGVPGRTLAPAFGQESAARHRRSGIVEIEPTAVDDRVRCDVDTLDDLAVARVLGLGAATTGVDASLGSPA